MNGMENTTYLPNAMTSPGMMVLSSTGNSGQDGSNCMPVPPHVFPVMPDKNHTGPFTASSFLSYHQNENPFPSSICRTMPQFPRSNVELSGFLNPNTSGLSAFQPLTRMKNDVTNMYSTFNMSQTKNDDESPSPYADQMVAIDYSGHKNSQCVEEDEQRPASSTLSEAPSSVHSELDENTNLDSKSKRKQRKRVLSDTSCCPVCGITLRSGEVQFHFDFELEKLEKINRSHKKSQSYKNLYQVKKVSSPQSTSSCSSGEPISDSTSSSRFETFLRIRTNRQSRLTARCKTKKRKEESVCPVCDEKLFGTADELNEHVELCLKQRDGAEDEDDPVDIEGEFEEYTWAGQTRVRATTLLGGGLADAGFHSSKKRNRDTDEDADLNVDGDESLEYGPPQFTEADVIRCSEASEDARDDSLLLRDSVIQCESSAYRDCEDIPNNNSESLDESQSEVTTTGAEDLADVEMIRRDSVMSAEKTVIESLKAKLKSQNKPEHYKCLICMETYTEPLASIQCWHVYCSQCWLRTLGAKKLCPQCNTITSPSDLRLIYL